MKNILGISCFYHDSAAAIICDGKIIAAAHEERFTRKKHTPDFPVNAIKYCLQETGLSIDELDAVVFYDKPFLKFERLLETYYAFSPKGLLSFLIAMPVWVKEKLFIKKILKDELSKIESYDKRKLKLLFPEHHLSHAASAFFASPFSESAILTIDGVGEWSTASIAHGDGNQIKIIKEIHFPHSVGLLYSAVTYYIGFVVNSGEYKLMGLAPYGNPNSEQTKNFISIIKKNLVSIYDDGSVHLNQKYFQYATGLRMVHDEKWKTLFGFVRRDSESEIEQHHCNLACAIQNVTEEIVMKMALEAKRVTGSKNICLAGGVALNCVANGKLLREKIFENIFIQPAAGDAGGALGAALAAHHLYFDEPRNVVEPDAMSGSYLGPEFSEKEILLMCKKYKATFEFTSDFQKLCDRTASLLADGNVVGWFQGRMEFGPRALGNRSILGDPRSAEMQKKLNLKIKYREGFRPFAPAVLAEDCQKYFDLETDSPYMLIVAPVKKELRHPLPANYHELPLMERLYFSRSSIQSVTHLDFSARVQTVHEKTNSKFHQLISAFKKITGVGMLVNTSFNVRGEPVVCSPEDAYRCFMRTEMDYLVVGNFIFTKTNQPEWKEKTDWRTEIKLD